MSDESQIGWHWSCFLGGPHNPSFQSRCALFNFTSAQLTHFTDGQFGAGEPQLAHMLIWTSELSANALDGLSVDRAELLSRPPALK